MVSVMKLSGSPGLMKVAAVVGRVGSSCVVIRFSSCTKSSIATLFEGLGDSSLNKLQKQMEGWL